MEIKAFVHLHHGDKGVVDSSKIYHIRKEWDDSSHYGTKTAISKQ